MPERDYNADGYRYGFNGKEKDDEVKGTGNSLNFDARIYDSRLGRWLSVDPLQMKYPNQSVYNFCVNNPTMFIDIDGRDVMVAFTGGFQGGGVIGKPELEGTNGRIIMEAQKEAANRGIEFNGAVIKSGATSGASVASAYDFIKANYSAGEKVIIYGYSYGGDFAVELAEKLKGDNITVDLLITVDASDGFVGLGLNATVNTTIPDNVVCNENSYQTEADKWGSNGGPNEADNKTKTDVQNYNKSGKGVEHQNMDEKTFDFNLRAIKNVMTPSSRPPFVNNSSGESKGSTKPVNGQVGPKRQDGSF